MCIKFCKQIHLEIYYTLLRLNLFETCIYIHKYRLKFENHLQIESMEVTSSNFATCVTNESTKFFDCRFTFLLGVQAYYSAQRIQHLSLFEIVVTIVACYTSSSFKQYLTFMTIQRFALDLKKIPCKIYTQPRIFSIPFFHIFSSHLKKLVFVGPVICYCYVLYLLLKNRSNITIKVFAFV